MLVWMVVSFYRWPWHGLAFCSRRTLPLTKGCWDSLQLRSQLLKRVQWEQYLSRNTREVWLWWSDELRCWWPQMWKDGFYEEVWLYTSRGCCRLKIEMCLSWLIMTVSNIFLDWAFQQVPFVSSFLNPQVYIF